MKHVFNIENGEFWLTESLIVSKSLTKDQLRKAFEPGRIKEWNYSNQTSQFSFKNHKIEDLYFLIIFDFKQDVFSGLQVLIQDRPYAEEASWDNFDFDYEEKMGELLKSWFEEQTQGKTVQTNWGEAQLVYDRHNLSHFLKISYYNP